MAAVPQPMSFQDVVALIDRLYNQPGTPEEFTRIQDVLQEVQRSSGGWQLADSLLECQDQHVRFFGALTFTVKLNSDWESISEDDIPVLCSRLVGWLVKLVNEDAPQLVIKKLCSTLVVYFIRFSESWPNCIRYLICCLAAGRAGLVEEFADMPASSHLLRTLKPSAMLAALWFTAILVEEVGKVDTKNIKNHHYCLKIQSNEAEAVELVKIAIEMPDGVGVIPKSFDPRVVDAGLRTFQAWTFYSLRAYIDFRAEFPLLKTLTQTAISWLTSDAVFEAACDVVIDILSLSFSFLTPEDNLSLATILTSPWAVKRYELLRSSDSDWISLQFARLLVTFSEATVQKLAKSLDSPSGRAIMGMLHGLLTIPGYPQVEDEVSVTTFEFWGSLVEFLLDCKGDGEDDSEWFAACQNEVKRAVEEFWVKIRIPPPREVAKWDKDQKDGFMSFRKDVADFVESAYSLLGSALFQQLVDQVVGTLALGKGVSWEEIEASLFCLNALSDSLSDEPFEFNFMERLFGSNLFAMLVDPRADIPSKARITSVNLIGLYASFFEQRPSYLPPALNFLFTCISTPGLARNASKSISSLCSSCRDTLTTELYAFLQQYELFAATRDADDIAKERVLCAIAFVIQALPSEDQQLDPLAKLLTHVERDAQLSLHLLQQDHQEEAKETALLSLRCLVAIGKGLQAPDDIPVDLSLDPDRRQAQPSFWEVTEGAVLQSKIVELVRMLCAAFHGDAEIVDIACAVFRTGFAETAPGLFVFPAESVTSFLLDHCAQPDTILPTASILVSSHSIPGSTDIAPQVRRLLGFVAELVRCDPRTDPSITQGVVEFLSRLLRRYTGVLVFFHPPERLEGIFLFALEALAVPETLVKKAAAGFWAQFLSLSLDEPEVQAAVDAITGSCGPSLVEKLVWALGGGCQRSEIDPFAEPLKKLVARYPRTRAWLNEALKSEGFPSANLGAKEKRVFVEKVISLRGKRQTNQVAKEFWLKARGTEFAYVS